MGEQSVGKSFALNHLVDTSFAMRTTGLFQAVYGPGKETLTRERSQRVSGCPFRPRRMRSSWRWISKVRSHSTTCVNTSSEIPCAIGVHSLERSAQEDTLLVLFNTAISNLVSN